MWAIHKYNWQHWEPFNKKQIIMNLILRTHENVNDPVWSVIISILILLVGVSYYIVYIMRIAFDELNDERPDK